METLEIKLTDQTVVRLEAAAERPGLTPEQLSEQWYADWVHGLGARLGGADLRSACPRHNATLKLNGAVKLEDMRAAGPRTQGTLLLKC